ncbi:MAG TPA: nucleotidyl transferase AbiEii/AbiGii toxin family protein [Bryobacteraceae bacterium]|nr:nucleotidyl transferase AbiEii/AbiGii toxin family protein [Bryobacteraceae bacterium]
MTNLRDLLRALGSADVDFILVGGVAAAAHGSGRLTQDVDIVYRRGADNIEKLVAGLESFRPYLRGAPPGLPFRFDAATISAGLNFTLTTDIGPIDLLGEIAGGGRYEDLSNHSICAEAFGVQCRVLDLETLIATKRAAGRPKDFEGIAELELLRDRHKPGVQ